MNTNQSDSDATIYTVAIPQPNKFRQKNRKLLLRSIRNSSYRNIFEKPFIGQRPHGTNI